MNSKRANLRPRFCQLCVMALSVLALTLAACHGTRNGALTPEEREAIETEVRAAVTDIYDEVCRWYNDNRDAIAEHDFDDRFLTRGFRSDRNTAGAIGTELNEAPPAMDYDHWIQAQDWDTLAFTIDSVCVISRDTADVFINIQNCGTDQPTTIVMVKERPGCHANGGSWVIDDFRVRDMQGQLSSERQALKQYIAAYTPTDSDSTLQAEVKARVMEFYSEMIAACQDAKAKGKTQSLYDFNTDRFLTRDYMLWYARVDSTDSERDGGDTFFFNTEHWGLNLEQDGIKDAQVLHVTVSNQPSRIPALQADVVVKLTCETYYLQSQTTITHSTVCLRLAYERGNWYVDDFPDSSTPITEKELMKQYVHQQWLQGVWDYDTKDAPAEDWQEVAAHYIIHADTLIYPKRCDPVEQNTYTFHLTSDTLYLSSTTDTSTMKIHYSFHDGKLWTAEIVGEDTPADTAEKTEYTNVKRE